MSFVLGCARETASLGDAGVTPRYALEVDAAKDATPQFSSSGRPEPSACMRQMGSFVGPSAYAYSVDWSPNANLLLTGTVGSLRLLAADLERESLSELVSFDLPDSQVYVKWAPDGHHAVSAGQEVRLLQVDAEPAQISELARYTGHTGPIIAVAWSRDGSYLLTGAKDESVRVLAVDLNKARLEEVAVFKGHVGRIFGVAWSPDGQSAVSAGEDGTMRLLSVDAVGGTIRELAQAKGAEWKNSVSWGPDDLVLSGDWGLFNRADMWSVGGSFVAQGLLTDFDRVGVQVLEWNAASNLLVTAAHDGNLQVFAYADRHFEGRAALQDWRYGVHAASWSPDAQHLAFAASAGERITLIDIRSCLRRSN